MAIKPPHVDKYVWDTLTVIPKPTPQKVKPGIERPARVAPVARPERLSLSFRDRLFVLGGEGSGNFGHGGRPGEVGGSSSESSSEADSIPAGKEGECFRNAARYVRVHDDFDLVHGKVTNGEGRTFDHAWAESSTQVADPTTGVKMDKDRWYDLLKAQPEAKYESTHATRNMLKTGNFGPWTPEEAETFRKPVDRPPTRPAMFKKSQRERSKAAAERRRQQGGAAGDAQRKKDWAMARGREQQRLIRAIRKRDAEQSLSAVWAKLIQQYDLDWDEAMHPRDEDGKFSETEGTRIREAIDRENAQMLAKHRVQKLIPGVITIDAKFPNINPHFTTAANHVADVLEQMKAEGLEMPKHVRIGYPENYESGVQARISGWNRKDDAGNIIAVDKDLIVEIPSTLPHDVELDDAVKVTFGKPSDVSPLHAYSDQEYKTYDRFTARTFKDVVTHEMGHVQAGHRGAIPYTDLLNRGAFRSMDEIRRATMRVSEYAKTSQDEFLAEAFTRLYRGETLAEDSQKLYDRLNGPKVPTR